METLILKIMASWGPAALVGAAAIIVLQAIRTQAKTLADLSKDVAGLPGKVIKAEADILQKIREDQDRRDQQLSLRLLTIENRLSEVEHEKVSQGEMARMIGGLKETIADVSARVKAIDDYVREKL